MAISFQFRKRYFLFLICLLALSTTMSNAGAADDVKPACNRLEGVKIPCGGGGSPGTPCGESCQSKFPNIGDTCSGTALGTICNGQATCYGTKCCDTCEAHKGQYCQDFYVCGQKCAGSAQVDCSGVVCLKPVISKGVATQKQVGDGCTPYSYCGSPVKAGDGCVCNCQMQGDQCTGSDNGKCTQCSCGTISGCSPKYKTVCVDDTQQQCVNYEHVPAVKDGPCSCKCPDGTGPVDLPACSKCN